MTARNPDPETGRVNLFDPEISADPQPLYAKLRAQCPVARSSFFDAPILSRYEDVVWGLRHPEIGAQFTEYLKNR